MWLVATPIGNLGDLSTRALEVLGQVDLVACEDTRRTGKLLAAKKIKVPLVSYFEGNERERVGELLVRLGNGDDVALVSDGGTPAISDPGYRLVRACAEQGIEVQVVPGPSAVIAALVVSGLPTDRFVFEGFLPKKPGERVRRLEALRHEPRTIVVFESPLRVQTLLRDVLVAIGDREIAVVRELTKLHEQIERGRVSQVLSRLGEHELKGEVVVVIGGERVRPDPRHVGVRRRGSRARRRGAPQARCRARRGRPVRRERERPVPGAARRLIEPVRSALAPLR